MSTSFGPQPAVLARETLKQLSARRIVPTPENYAKVYAEVAQVPLADVQPPLGVIETIQRELRADPARAAIAQEIGDALAKHDWSRVKQAVKSLLARVPRSDGAPLVRAVPATTAAEPVPATPAIIIAPAKTDSPKPDLGPAANDGDDPSIAALKELFTRTLTHLVDERLGYSSEVVEDARALAVHVKTAHTPAQLERATSKLRHLWIRLETRGEGPEPLMRGLHGLLLLLLSNMGDLAADDQWAHAQIDSAHSLLNTALTPKVIAEAERNFKEFAYRQGSLRGRIDEAKTAVREMMASFIERLGTVATTTGTFAGKLHGYSQAIRDAKDLSEVSAVLEHLIDDTNQTQSMAAQSAGEMDLTRRQVAEYEARVQELESELEEISVQVREDPLTQALNRRGFDQQYAVEESRAKRKNADLSLAMIDLDNFKRLNDRLGHPAGDAALKHVANVVRQLIRPTDTLARFGGEEFVVLLPETSADFAHRAMSRIQAELAKRPLVWSTDNEQEEVVLTFSCGIAVRGTDEAQQALIERADNAMYDAKRAGKNCVVTAK